MSRDQQGLPLAGADGSIESYNLAILDYYGLTGDPVGMLKAALARDPSFAMGAIAIAGLYMIGGFRPDQVEVEQSIAAARAAIDGASARERLHLEAIETWAEGRMRDATAVWEEILVDHPRDALALRFAHDAYFFLGASAIIRDSVARVLPAYDEKSPLTGFLLGMHAFGLEETGDYIRAEAAARNALSANPSDAWAAHALAHVFEMSCRAEEGVAFLRGSHSDWRGAHFMAGHNGWHLGLYLIELGRGEEALADYDRFTAPKLASDASLDRVDAASLLWRLELAGFDVGARWKPIASQWMRHLHDHLLAFNDLHLAFAVARSGDRRHIALLTDSLDLYAREGRGDNVAITAEIGRRLIEGVLAFAVGAYAETIENVLPVRYDAIRIGGSHAQRDVIDLTLIAAAERAGEWRLARALRAERVALRPTARERAGYAQAEAAARAD